MKFIPYGTTSGSIEKVYPCTAEISNDQGYTAYTACELMIKEGQEYMACFYGKPKEIHCKVYNYNCVLVQLKSYVGTNEIDESGKFFKVSVLPTTREKALICMINQNKFLCISYDITSNTFGEYNTPIETNTCSNNYVDSIIVEYFYETERFLVGCLGTSSSFYLAEYNSDMNYISYDTYNTGVDTYLVRLNINIILPNCKNQYIIFANTGSSGQIDSSLSLTINKIHNYPINGEYSSTLYCEIYYNYDHTGCLTAVPEGYYSIGDKTIDKCYDSCKTCSTGGTATNHNCLTCKSEYSLKLKDNYDHENCYSSCSDYYYIDESNDFHCVTGGCPTNYKLIYSTTTNQCVRNCPSDQYEYKDICYSTCPQDTTESPTNSHLCELNCKYFDKYLIVGQT